MKKASNGMKFMPAYSRLVFRIPWKYMGQKKHIHWRSTENMKSMLNAAAEVQLRKILVEMVGLG